MTEISAALVKELRDMTNVGMMECKKALQECGGDKDKAIKWLRERGMAIAGKKASREVKSGLLSAGTFQDGTVGAMIEVNCETDFVARNAIFQKFVNELLQKASGLADGELPTAAEADRAAKVAEIGENIVVRRNVLVKATAPGAVFSYIHLGSKVGVLVEVGCTKAESAQTESFKELGKDLTLHVAANNPAYLNRAAVTADVIESEKAIYAKQVTGKPENIVEKIVVGKMEKFFATSCFVEQPFVKDPDQTVTQLVDAKGKALGDTLTVRRFVRWTLGE